MLKSPREGTSTYVVRSSQLEAVDAQAVTFFGWMGSSLGFVWMVRDMIRKVLVPVKQELHIACLFVYSLVYISYVYIL